MADEIAQVGVGIESQDRTGPGVKSAEKNFAKVGKAAEKANRKSFSEAKKAAEQAANDDEKINQRRARSLFSYARTARSTFASVEKAAARSFGTRSIASGVEGTMSKVGNTLRLFSTAMGEAGEGAAGLEVGLGMAATGIGAVIAVAAAGTIAAQKFGDAWAEAGNKVARSAQVFGVNSQTMQAFDAVAQRFGAAKGVGAQAVTGISQGLNDALYGDAQKRFVFSQAGIALRRNKDGSAIVDDKTLANIADSMSKRNNVGQRQIAAALGIPLDAIPAFIQGAQSLGGQLGDARRFANVQSDASLAHAEARTQKSAQLSQVIDRGKAKAGEAAASLTDGLVSTELDAAKVFSQAVDGNFKGAIDVIGTASKTFSDAVDQFMLASNPALYAGVHGLKAIWDHFEGGASGMSVSDVNAHAQRASAFRDKLIDKYKADPKTATMLASSAELESGLNPRANERGGKGSGLWQITDPMRRARFKDVTGKYIEQASEDDQIRYQLWELKHSEASSYNRIMAAGGSNADAAAAYRADIERPWDKVGDAQKSGAVAAAMDKIPVHVTVEVPHAPPGTRATARTPGGAVSHAMAN